jgi:PAS domain S-box-containing protein
VKTLPLPRAPYTSIQTFEVNYHALLAGSPDTVILVDIDTGRLLDANANAQALLGRDEKTLLGSTIYELCPPRQPDGKDSRDTLVDTIGKVVDGDIRVHEVTLQHAGGRQILCEMRLVQLPPPHHHMLHARIVDISRRHRADQLRIGQGRLLEMVARGAPLKETLDQLMLLIESQSDGVLCSVLLLDEDGCTIRPCAGPSLAPSYMAMLDGLLIGEGQGSCGTAMFRKDLVVVSDIMTDPLWAPYTGLVEPYGLRACWSTPIYLDKDHVLGSFAMYYREVRSPGEDDMKLIAVATHLAGIAIERTRRERELAQHREHLEELVGARTAELTAAQAELARRDKLAALGSLVSGIAHELNTPIGNSLTLATTMADRTRTISASLGQGLRRSTLEAHLAEMEGAHQILVRNLERAASLVASFKQISMDHVREQRRVFSLTALLNDVVPPLRIAVKGKAVTVRLQAEAGLDMDSYPGPLAQVLAKLFDNCLVHAFDIAGGAILIDARRHSAGTVSLSVADNGAGIPAELLPKIYNPFFTTKLGSGGSGLGLHVAHNIVTGVLGGRIEASSSVGAGTTLTLVLPVAAPDFAQGGAAHA